MYLDITTWWQALSAPEQWFWAIGLISNALFAIYVIMQFAGGHDTEFHSSDVDVSGVDVSDVDSGDAGTDTDTGFTILSLRSLLAFGMFMGYTGVATLRLGLNWFFALITGVGAGMLAAWLAWRLLRLILHLQSSGTLDMHNTIGQTGTVHLQIPAIGEGTGKVMVEVQGALREMDAVSEEGSISTGDTIIVVGTTDEGNLIVQPFKTPLKHKLPELLISL